MEYTAIPVCFNEARKDGLKYYWYGRVKSDGKVHYGITYDGLLAIMSFILIILVCEEGDYQAYNSHDEG